MAKTVRILIADDCELLLDELAAQIGEEFEVVGKAHDGAELVAIAKDLEPDVVVTDIRMPGIDGIEATRRLMLSRPTSCIVLLSMHSDLSLVQKGLEAGACGYVLKIFAGDDLDTAIRAALDRRIFISPAIFANS